MKSMLLTLVLGMGTQAFSESLFELEGVDRMGKPCVLKVEEFHRKGPMAFIKVRTKQNEDPYILTHNVRIPKRVEYWMGRQRPKMNLGRISIELRQVPSLNALKESKSYHVIANVGRRSCFDLRLVE